MAKLRKRMKKNIDCTQMIFDIAQRYMGRGSFTMSNRYTFEKPLTNISRVKIVNVKVARRSRPAVAVDHIHRMIC